MTVLYTPDDDATIIRMWKAGHGDAIIAVALNRSAKGIKQRRILLGLSSSDRASSRSASHKEWTSDDLTTLRVMWCAGKSDHEIGETLGRSTAAVSIARIKQGWKQRRGKPVVGERSPIEEADYECPSGDSIFLNALFAAHPGGYQDGHVAPVRRAHFPRQYNYSLLGSSAA
jgi:hypothetical protein